MPDMEQIKKDGVVKVVHIETDDINDDPWLDGRLCTDFGLWSFRVVERLQIDYKDILSRIRIKSGSDPASGLPGNY